MKNSDEVAVFWDYANCSIPSSASGYSVVNNIRSVAQPFGSITTFKAYMEINTGVGEQLAAGRNLVLRSELQCSGVTLVDCPKNGQKDVADKMMLVDMFAHAIDKPSPSTIVLISGDKDFAYALSVLRMRRYKVVLITLPSAHISLVSQASVRFDWSTHALGGTFSEDPSAKHGRTKSFSTNGNAGMGDFSMPTPRARPVGTFYDDEGCDLNEFVQEGVKSSSNRVTPTSVCNVCGHGKRPSSPVPLRTSRSSFLPPSQGFGVEAPGRCPSSLSDVSADEDAVHPTDPRGNFVLGGATTPSTIASTSQLSTSTTTRPTTTDTTPSATRTWGSLMDPSVPEFKVHSKGPATSLPEPASVSIPSQSQSPATSHLRNPLPGPAADPSLERVPSSSPSTPRVPPPHFKTLVDWLRSQRTKGVYCPLRSQAAMGLGTPVYKKAGVSTFREYANLAVAAGIVTLGGPKAGGEWISLQDEWVGAA